MPRTPRQRQSLRNFLRTGRSVTRPLIARDAVCAVEIRRLYDVELVDDAYGAAVTLVLPREIVMLSDGSCVVEYEHVGDRIETVVRESEETRELRLMETDKDRELRVMTHLLEGAPLRDGIEVQIAWRVDGRVRYASESDMWRDLHRRAVARRRLLRGQDAIGLAAIRYFGGEKFVAGSLADSETIRAAWVSRSSALRATLASQTDIGADLRVERVKPRTDDRKLDTRGRRNGGARQKPGATLRT